MKTYKCKWPAGLRGPGFTAPPRWRSWSADLCDLGDGITAQAWAPTAGGWTWYATSEGEWLMVRDGQAPAEVYEQLHAPVPEQVPDPGDCEAVDDVG